MSEPRHVTFEVATERAIARLVGVSVAIEIGLVLLDATVNYSRWSEIGSIRRLFNITREDGMASWFGVTQTLFVGLTALVIWLAVRKQDAPRWTRRGWLAVSIFFLYMAMDDGSKLHERIGTAFGKIFAAGEGDDASTTIFSGVLDLFPSYNWQLVLLPVFGTAGLLILVFLWRELAERRARMIVLIAIGCLVVAVGMDFAEGLEEDHAVNPYTWLDEKLDLDDFCDTRFDKTPYEAMVHFSKSGEEFLEMLAHTLIWAVFLAHLARIVPKLDIRFS